MHKNSQRVDGDRNRRGLVAVLVFESFDFVVFHLATHRPHIGGALGQRGRRSGRTGGLNLNVYVGVGALELFRPECHQVGKRVGAHAREIAGNTAGAFVRAQGRIKVGRQHMHTGQPPKQQTD